MLPWHCFCDGIPRIEATTRIVLVMHCREGRKLTNTGRLVALALPGSEIIEHGRPGEATSVLDVPHVADPGRQVYLLFPTEAAQTLSRAEVQADGRPVTLVVPDGTWRQAKRMPRRVAGLHGLPHRCLPAGPPSRYRLRSTPHSGQLATCEAVSRALGIVECEALQARLNELFDRMVESTLAARAGR